MEEEGEGCSPIATERDVDDELLRAEELREVLALGCDRRVAGGRETPRRCVDWTFVV